MTFKDIETAANEMIGKITVGAVNGVELLAALSMIKDLAKEMQKHVTEKHHHSVPPKAEG
jgi:hypothetical protein